jgi:hypothetical protein
MDIKGLSEPKTVPLKAIEYDMHGRTVHLIPCGSYLCADCKQTAKWNVIEYAEDAGDERNTHGWLWCGVCSVGG